MPEYADQYADPAEFASAVQQKVLTQTRIGASVAVSLTVKAVEELWNPTDRTADHLRLQLEAYCLTDHLVSETKTVDFDEEVTVRRPATWWDHFKAEQVEATSPLWRWVARRWPPRMTTETHRLTKSVDVTFEAKRLYPYNDYVLPEFGKPTLVESYSTSRRY